MSSTIEVGREVGREKTTSSTTSTIISRKLSTSAGVAEKATTTPRKLNTSSISAGPVASTSKLTSSTTSTVKSTVPKNGISNSSSINTSTRKAVPSVTTGAAAIVRNTPSKSTSTPTVAALGRKKGMTTLSSSPSSAITRINSQSTNPSNRKSITSTPVPLLTPASKKSSAVTIGKKPSMSTPVGKEKILVKVGSLLLKKKIPVVEVVNEVAIEVIPAVVDSTEKKNEKEEKEEVEVKGVEAIVEEPSLVEEVKIEKVAVESEEEMETLADETITIDTEIVEDSSRRDSWETLPPSARASIASAIVFNPIPEASAVSSTTQSVIPVSLSEVEKSIVVEEEVGNQSWETESGLNCSQSSIIPNILTRSPELSILPSRRTSLPLLISTKIPRHGAGTQSDSPSNLQISPNPILISPQSQVNKNQRPISTITKGTKISHNRSLSYSPLLSSAASTISFNSTSTSSSATSSFSSSSNSIKTSRSPPSNLNDRPATVFTNQIRIQPGNIISIPITTTIDSLPPPPPADHYKPLPILERSPRSQFFSRSISSPSLTLDQKEKKSPSTATLGNHRESMTLDELLKQGSSSPTTTRGGKLAGVGGDGKVDWLLSGREGDDDGFEKAMRRNYEDLLEEEIELGVEKIVIASSSTSSPTATIRSQQQQSQIQQNRKKSTSLESIEIWRTRCETLENSLRLERQQFALERQAWDLYKRQSQSQDSSPDNNSNSNSKGNNELDEKKVHSIELSWKRAAGSMEISRRNYLALADAARTEREIVGSQLESLSILTNLMKNLKKK